MLSLNMQVIQRLMRFRFDPRRSLEGRYTGRHASPQRGQSVEFRDYRQYLPGDDMGHVDWKIYGRTDKLYVRLFEHETELVVTLLVDASNSMAYPRDGSVSKFEQACTLAAAIGFIVTGGQDRVGFGFSQGTLKHFRRPSSSLPQMMQVVEQMRSCSPSGKANLGESMDQLASQLHRGEIVIVLSDLWDDLDDVFRAASRIHHVGGELILFHVLHQHELDLPQGQGAILIDSETLDQLPVDFNEVRSAYARELEKHLATVRHRCRQHRAEYVFAPLSESFERTLERFLTRRSSG